MELLITLLFEGIGPLIELTMVLMVEGIALAAALLELLIELVVFLVSLLLQAVGRKPLPQPSPPATEATAESVATTAETAGAATSETTVARPVRSGFSPGAARWRKVLAGGALVVALLIGIGFWIANTFFFETILRQQLAKVDAKTGIAISFESAQGSLWSARVEMTGVRVRRPEHPIARYDLEIRELLFDGDLIGRREVAECRLVGVRGKIERVGDAKPGDAGRPFTIEKLSIQDSEIQVADLRPAKPIGAQVTLESFECQRLRSDWVVFDTFFRAQVAGKIDGQPFSIRSQTIADGRETEWHAKGLPIRLVAPYLGPPLTWATEGSVDLDVTDRWRTKGLREVPLELAMHWKLELHDVRAELPADLPKTERVIAEPIVKLVNTTGKQLPLEFDLKFDGEEFHLAGSVEVVGLWKQVGEAVAEKLADRAGIDPGVAKKAAGKAWEVLKGWKKK